MAQEHEYKCNGCGRIASRDTLTVKKIIFVTMGEGSRTIRSRVKAWLCHHCVQGDVDWNLPKNRQPSERVPPAEPKELQ